MRTDQVLGFLKTTGRSKTPQLLQMEAVECGAAALGIVLGYYGRYVPLAELRSECGVSRDGSKAANVVKAARRYGLVAKGFTKEVETLREMRLPAIIFWRFNHFLVVEGFGRDEVFLNDPSQGHATISWEEFDDGFTGVVLTFEPGPDFKRGGRKPSITGALARRLRGSYIALLYCFLAGIFLVLPSLAAAAFTSIFVDNLLIDRRVTWLRPLLVAMAAVVVVQSSLKLLQLTYLRRLKIALAARMTSRFFWHLLRLPMAFYAQRYPGEVSNRSQLNVKVADTLSGRLATTMIDVTTMIFYAVVMSYYDIVLTAIAAGSALLNFLALRRLSKRRVEANVKLAHETGKSGGIAIAALQSIETVKAAAAEPEKFQQFIGQYAKGSNARMELEEPNMWLSVLPTLLQTLTIVAILIVGGLRVINGEISIGMLVAFQMLTISFLAPVGNLVELGKSLQELQGDLSRLDDVLDNPQIDDGRATEPPQTPDTPGMSGDREAHPTYKLRGELELRGITFGYSPLSYPLIQDFELHVKPGQRVALVGASGSGKSTMAKVISGLYEPWEGSILFDGQSRKQHLPQTLQNSIGLVDQDVMLFEGTVRDNLTLWDPTVANSVLERACRDAMIHTDVMALPGGYQSALPEGGASLSGGQRQRLEIARALINNPSLLILDEATSALDAETERLISDNLRLRGCTCVIIAHRLSTIRDCDEIIVLERGKVMQRGRHDELWAAEGPYTRLIQEEQS